MSRRSYSHRQLAHVYFLLQGAAVTVWWIILAVIPETRQPFAMHDSTFATISAFATGDLIVIAIGSAVVGFGRSRVWNASLEWMVTGAVMYAALYTVTAAVIGIIPLAGALLMVPAAVASVISASILSQHESPDALSTSPRT